MQHSSYQNDLTIALIKATNTIAISCIFFHILHAISCMELDFVLKDKGRLFIIEVKSGNDYHRHAALDNAHAENPERFKRRIVLCKGNVEAADSGVIYLPLYMAMFL